MREYEDADDDIGADCEIEMTMAMLFHLLRCFFLLIFSPQVGPTDCSVQNWGARLRPALQTPGLSHVATLPQYPIILKIFRVGFGYC